MLQNCETVWHTHGAVNLSGLLGRSALSTNIRWLRERMSYLMLVLMHRGGTRAVLDRYLSHVQPFMRTLQPAPTKMSLGSAMLILTRYQPRLPRAESTLCFTRTSVARSVGQWNMRTQSKAHYNDLFEPGLTRMPVTSDWMVLPERVKHSYDMVIDVVMGSRESPRHVLPRLARSFYVLVLCQRPLWDAEDLAIQELHGFQKHRTVDLEGIFVVVYQRRSVGQQHGCPPKPTPRKR